MDEPMIIGASSLDEEADPLPEILGKTAETNPEEGMFAKKG